MHFLINKGNDDTVRVITILFTDIGGVARRFSDSIVDKMVIEIVDTQTRLC